MVVPTRGVPAVLPIARDMSLPSAELCPGLALGLER